MDNFLKRTVAFETPDDYEEWKKTYWSDENIAYMNYVTDMEKKYGKNFETVLNSMTDKEYEKYKRLLDDNPMNKPKTALVKDSKNVRIELNKDIASTNTQIDKLKNQFKQLTDGYSYDEWFSEFTSIEDGYGRVTADDEPDVIKLKDISKKIKKLFSERSTLLSKLPTLAVQGKTFSIEDSLKGANPKYARGTQYGVNCQRCVQAYELRRRGYDVEALPKPKKNKFGILRVDDKDITTDISKLSATVRW